jgi:hypothetical protein
MTPLLIGGQAGSTSTPLHVVLDSSAKERFAMSKKALMAVALSPIAVLAITLSLYLYLPTGKTATDAGEAEAERDITAGTLKLKEMGYLAPWADVWIDLMKERLGIEVEVVAGCVVTEELLANVKGYNRRMNQEIERQFGAGVVKALVQEAREKYEAARTDAKKGEP